MMTAYAYPRNKAGEAAIGTSGNLRENNFIERVYFDANGYALCRQAFTVWPNEV